MAAYQKKAYIVVTPLKSKNVIEQKCMKYNLSSETIKAIADFVVPKHQKESESDLNETTCPTSKPTKSSKNAFNYGTSHKSENKEVCNECDLLTVDQKIKISSSRKKQTVTSDFKKNTRLSKLKKTENQATMSFYKHQSSSDLSADESETEEEIRMQAGVAKKTIARNTKDTVLHWRKSSRNSRRKIPVSESETEESENEFCIKQKKARCSAKKNLQKSSVRNESPVNMMESDKTKNHSLQCLPDLIQDEEWNEKELKKLHW